METKAHHEPRSSLDLEPPSSLQRLSVAVGDDHRISPEEAPYTCSYCDRRFFNKYALAGHQNAHKLERDAGKRKHRGLVATSSSPAPVRAVRWLLGGREVCGADDPASAAAPAVGSSHDKGEAAAEPGADLSLKL